MGKQVRLNSEKKIDDDSFKLKIGTANKISPKVIYIEGKTFITPQIELNDYCEDINIIKKNFKKKIGMSLNNNTIFDKKFILDFDVASSRMLKGKKTFISFQFLMKQSNEKTRKLKDVKTLCEPMILDLISDLKYNIESHNFLITKNKKDK